MKMEKIQIQPLVDALVEVVRKGVTGIDLLEIFLGRRIQPLQARHHAMWLYSGPEDSTRTNPECVTRELVMSWAWTNWFSPISNGNPAEEEEGNQEGGVESVEYVSDSGEMEEESEEEEGEDEEQNSPPPPPEPRTKCRHEPVAPSAPPAASSAPPAPPVVPSALPASPVVPSARSTKRTRESAAEPAGQHSKVAKPSGSKPRKASPRMRIAVPVASAAATSATSLPRQGDDPMDTDNVVTSQQVEFPSEVIQVVEDDQKRSEQAAAPVLEAVPSVTTPAMDAPPAEAMPSTETALIAAGPTGAGLGMPKESLVVPGPSTVQYDVQRLGVLAEREKSLEESREANKALVAEMEKMGKQRTELMGQMKVMNRRCISQEKYVSDWARKMIALLGDFCMDAEAEAADVERSVIPNVPLGEDANRDLLRAHIRLGKVGPFIGRLREVVGRIDKELWPEDESRQEMEGLMTRPRTPQPKSAWKKSRCSSVRACRWSECTARRLAKRS
ncbi:hypothetical protein ZWY2020_010101 [Hordeum vulgare]|nr:hypothetical protein ZWY2020_010101 [Hordeum vulgare]